jgi:hypothetical protein
VVSVSLNSQVAGFRAPPRRQLDALGDPAS